MKSVRLTEVERELEDPKIWDDPKRAQDLGREKKALERVVLELTVVEAGLKDSGELFGLARAENDRRGCPQSILDFRDSIGMPHKFQNSLPGRLGIDGSAIEDILRSLTFSAKLAAHFDLYLGDFHPLFAAFPIKVVAIAGSQREKEQLAPVDARTKAVSPGRDRHRLTPVVRLHSGRVFASLIHNLR